MARPKQSKVQRGALRQSAAAASMKSAAPASGGVPAWVWVTGAAAIAGGGYYFWQKYKSGTSSMPITPLQGVAGGNRSMVPGLTPLPGQATGGTGGGSSGGSSSDITAITQSPTVTLINLLRSNRTARLIYALQAAMYSCGLTFMRPDGIYGHTTAGLIGQINQASGLTNASTAFSQNVLQYVPGAINVIKGTQSPQCDLILPDFLPQDVIDSVNNDALSVYPQFPLLQATSSG